MSTPWEDITDIRAMHIPGGYNPVRFIELYGGIMVELWVAEPDPTTYRNEFYYNTSLNKLFRRIYNRNEPSTGEIVAYWRPISNPG